MIYVTGDTHGQIDFAKLNHFAKSNPSLGKDDYVIIAGDFGAVWNEKTLNRDLKPYERLPFSVLFVDGNHENFDLLNSFPVETWHGGKIHRIRPNIIHLKRGQIFNIEGNIIFVFGGATSIDRAIRVEFISWWKEELPSAAEMEEAYENLKQTRFKVDYIITHSCDERALYYPPLRSGGNIMHSFPENRMLSYFEENVKYKKWYFGHYHLDGELSDRKRALYNDIVKLGD